MEDVFKGQNRSVFSDKNEFKKGNVSKPTPNKTRFILGRFFSVKIFDNILEIKN